ncbi:MAG: hypothetical protein Q4C98_08040 [Capnocytophaga sp.]|nr:hypothetical protein [Capnocytophaga sp.]
MTTEKIKILLDNYFEGNTSLEEEQKLRTYFNSSNIAPELEKYKSMFAYLQDTKNETFPTNKIIKRPRKLNWYRLTAVAATFLFIITYYWYQKREQAEAQLAFEQVKTALQMISVNYNKGTEKIKYLEKFDATTNKVINMEKLK